MMHRRDFLRTTAAVGLGFMGLRASAFGAEALGNELDLGEFDFFSPGYGELVPDKNKILDLPKGFSYKIIAKAGEKMGDGLYMPGRPDGMGAFATETGKVLLIRNHENSPHELHHSAFGSKNQLLRRLSKSKLYDYGFGKNPHLGGTTSLIFNEKTQKVERSFVSLAGTSRNCAGGVAPWGSWLTCEEDIRNVDDLNERKHGYVFEVRASERMAAQTPVALKAMGRFNHEAVAVDPRTGIVYLTEDRHEGLFYRFIPKTKGRLRDGGKLQALAFVWKKGMDTRNWDSARLESGMAYSAEWITLSNVDSAADDLRYRGHKLGAAIFARGEGCWAGNGSIYFACTNGGKQKLGQIFRYTPSKYEGTRNEKSKNHYPRIELFVEPNNRGFLRYCDNLTVAPWGDLVFCEDNDSPRIVGITPEGKFYKIAHNVGYKSELAGVCFSPTGKTLFFNIQDAGLTVAITGKWR